MTRLHSAYDRHDKLARASRNVYAKVLEVYAKQEEKLRHGGGHAAIERQHKKGRLTARERIERLCDKDEPFLELGLFAAWELYAEWGDVPGRPAWCAASAASTAGRSWSSPTTPR